MDTLPKCFKPAMKATLMTLFDTYLQPSITFLRRNLVEPVPTVDNQVRVPHLSTRSQSLCLSPSSSSSLSPFLSSPSLPTSPLSLLGLNSCASFAPSLLSCSSCTVLCMVCCVCFP
jgi:hypothetical protein